MLCAHMKYDSATARTSWQQTENSSSAVCDDQATFGCQARNTPRFLWRSNQRPDSAEKTN